MVQQLALPGLGEPDPLAEAREELRRVRAAWEAVAHIAESEERSRLQPRYREAIIRVDRLEHGPAWWHR
jgi:hypothetical protein